MKSFNLDEQFFTDVIVRTNHSVKDLENPTNEELVKVLKGACTISTKNIDHPEFTNLRNQLAELGLIRIEHGYWNGDRVLKSFILNGKVFKKNTQFPCAAAMLGPLKFAIK
jgi:hypothetical protein